MGATCGAIGSCGSPIRRAGSVHGRHWLAALAAFCAGCTPAPEPPDLDVAYGDCETVVDGPVCLLGDDSRLRLSVLGAGDVDVDVEQQVDGAWRSAEAVREADGTLIHLGLAPAAQEVRLRAGGHTVWQLALGREALPEPLRQPAAAVRATDKSGLESAAAALRAYATDATAPRRGTALGLLARAQIRLGQRQEAVRNLRAAIDANVADGRRLEALRDTNVLVHVRYYREARYQEVGALYTRLGMPDQAPAEAVFFEAYYRGNAALEAGDGRLARDRLEAAAAMARRMGWERRALDADQSLAMHLMHSGQRRQATRVLQAWRARGLPDALRACDRAAFDVNLGWLALLQLEAGEAAEDPTGSLREAQIRMDEHCTLRDRVNVRVNLALAHYHAGRPAEAIATLSAARALTDAPGAILRLWAHDIDARAALAVGDLDGAEAQLAELDALARITLSQDGRWRAAVGKARLARARGDPVAALAQYRAANRWLERDLVRLPVGGGRDSLLAARQRARQEQMDLLLELRHHDDALALARRHAAEVLATLGGGEAAAQSDALRRYRLLRRELQAEVADSWTLPQDEKDRLLARSRDAEKTLLNLLDAALGGADASATPLEATVALAPGAVEIVFFPRHADWVVFVHDAGGARAYVKECGAVTGDAVADCLLEPLRAQVGDMRSLRIVPSGSLWAVDFHARQIDGVPLMEHATVEYALGLPPTDATRAGDVLAVADSRGDLPYAREELALVRESLGGREGIAALQGREATSARVIDALTRSAVFHFAGHARLAGAGGWQSELALASDTALTVPDVLALAQVPSYVVLSGCETAATTTSAAASIGLGQAFLVRGADTVVAAVRPVDDQTTLALMRELYARWDGRSDLSDALREAQRQLRAQSPGADWAAFRAITR